MALYRTYRPARLDDVVGQEHVTGPLRRALENDRVHHAYLFSGPRGCGKTSTARILARSLNCEQGPTPDPCGTCQSCMDLAPQGPGSIDVIELDAASHGGVDDTRELRERAMFAPASSRYKVYIIDEAHMVSPQGFNALLKLVEEPPPHVRFIFATTEPEKVLPTIRSRTHNYTFRLIPLRTLQQHLAMVCEAEGVPAEPAALALVARAGTGSVRDCLSVLGQVISGSGADGVTYAETVAQLGMTDAALLDDTITALADHDGARLFTVIDQVIDVGHDPRRFVTDLLERFRDLIVLTNVPEAAALGLIEAPEDQVAREVEQAARFGLPELTRAAELTSSTLSELRGATAPRLHLELMAARLLLPASDIDEVSLRARLDQLERRIASAPLAAATAAPAAAAQVDRQPPSPPTASSPPAASQSPRPTPQAPPASATGPVSPPPRRPKPAAPEAAPAATQESAPTPSDPTPSDPTPSDPTPSDPTPPTGPEYAATLDEFASMWPAVLESVASLSRVAWLSLGQSAPVSLSNGVLAVSVDNAGKIRNIKERRTDELLRQAILDVMKADVRIDIILAPESTGRSATAPATPATPAAPIDADAPSLDDPDAESASGVDLALRELGATRIGEIEH